MWIPQCNIFYGIILEDENSSHIGCEATNDYSHWQGVVWCLVYVENKLAWNWQFHVKVHTFRTYWKVSIHVNLPNFGGKLVHLSNQLHIKAI